MRDTATMTDRELLELAAKAAGYKVCRWTDDEKALLLYGIQEPWNSLHENPHSDCMGDALRLAVKLDMNLFQASNSAYALPSDDDGTNEQKVRYVDADGDSLAATRRAITRCAAAVALASSQPAVDK